MNSDQEALDNLVMVSAERHAAAQGQRHEPARIGNSDGIDLGSMKAVDMRQFVAYFVPVMRTCQLTKQLAAFEKITERQKAFEKRAKLPTDPKTLAAWDSAVLELATGKGTIEKAVQAGVASQQQRARLEAEALVCKSAASAAIGIANRWALDNYAELVSEMDAFFQVKLAAAVEAVKLLPEGVSTADLAIRDGETTASAFAIVDAATQVWNECLRALTIEKTLYTDKRDYERYELLRSLARPENVTRETRKMASPLQLVAAANDGAQPGIFTSVQARETDTRLREPGAEIGLLSGGTLDVFKGLGYQTYVVANATYMNPAPNAVRLNR
jgi:hypothetical protein